MTLDRARAVADRIDCLTQALAADTKLLFEMPRLVRRLLELIATPEAIVQVIGDLVDDMVAVLQAPGLGLRVAMLTCLRVDGVEQRIGLGTAKSARDAAHLKRIFAMRVERIDPISGSRQ